VLTYKQIARHLSFTNQKEAADRYYKDALKSSNKIAKLVKLQKALKNEIAEEIIADRFWNKAFAAVADAQYDMIGV
jgi:hypothetical protein